MASSAPASDRCAECGEAIDPADPVMTTPKGRVCKWCGAEKQVRQQQAAPTFTPTYSRPQSQGMSGIAILRLVLVAIALIFAFARHC